jgi:hypothetical protein
MKVVIGPWIGSIEQEIFTFRPYAKWLYESLQSYRSDFYISTHEQHQFLYDWPDINFIPVDKKFSNDADHQGVMNSKVNNKDYLTLVKQLKNSIGIGNGNGSSDAIFCNVRYTKYDNFIVPVSKNIFNKVRLTTESTNDILIISRYGDQNIIRKLCKSLPEVIEINGNYSSTEILQKILSAKLVICPCGVWTCFCNLHEIPVFSWADGGLGMYKPDGVYHFNNYNSHVIHHDGDDIDILLSGVDYVKKRVEI